jgi:DNA-binding PadR family transcriptional regulator
MYGLELVRESDGRLKRGSVYVTLNRMEEKGYVAFREEAAAPIEGGMPRPLYRATGQGARVFRAWQLVQRQLSINGALV